MDIEEPCRTESPDKRERRALLGTDWPRTGAAPASFLVAVRNAAPSGPPASSLLPAPRGDAEQLRQRSRALHFLAVIDH